MGLNLLSLFNRGKNKEVLGIEFRKNSARIAVLRKDGEDFSLPTLPFEIPIPDSIEDAGNLLKDELSRRDLKNLLVVTGLPPSSLFFKSLRLPKEAKENLVDTIEYNIREDINTIQGNTFYDYHIISEDEEGLLEILVIIAKLGDIERLVDICKVAGLNLDIIDAEPVALINLASHLIKVKLSEKGISEDNICIIHLDEKESYLSFFHKNVFVQSLNFNSKNYEKMDPDERESVVESLVNEINYFFLTIHEPKVIFMSGDSFKFPEIKAYMQLKFGNRFDLEDLDPVEALNLDYQGNVSLGIFNIPISLAFRGFTR